VSWHPDRAKACLGVVGRNGDLRGTWLHSYVSQGMRQTTCVYAAETRKVSVASAIARSQNDIMLAFDGQVFGSVRQRVGRHLLGLAAGAFEPGKPLVAAVPQHQLAAAVRSAREVVAFVLDELRAARAGILRRDRARLRREAEPNSGE
jgi:hypothetical protein